MDYIEWSNEYFIESEKLKQILEALKKERSKYDGENIKELNRRITILYSMYLECRHTAKLLYDRAGGNIA